MRGTGKEEMPESRLAVKDKVGALVFIHNQPLAANRMRHIPRNKMATVVGSCGLISTPLAPSLVTGKAILLWDI